MKNTRNAFFLFILLFLCICPIFALAQTKAAKPITSPRCNEFTFDASGSYDPDNRRLSFFWDFGDGITGTDPVMDHTYQKDGEYIVTLTIKDDSGMECGTNTISQVVRANIPPHAAFKSPEMVCSNQPVPFDASESYDDSGSPLSFEWDFGDGTKSAGEKLLSKTYSKGGRYKVTLTANDNSNLPCSRKTFTKDIVVNDPPIAEAGPDEILQCVSQDSDYVISFDASQSSDVNNDRLNFYWDFGDGKTAEGDKVTHRYADVGTYDVKLIAKDNTDVGCGTAVDFVTVRLNKMPIANAGEDILACPMEEITFDGSQSFVFKKGTASARWSFGDGETANGFVTKHIYRNPGQYQASLGVETELNKMCPESRDTKLITINSNPTVILKASESVCLTNPVTFEASAQDGDSDPLEFYWSFGDGEILKGESKVTHNYAQGGYYRATVIVDDAKGTACSTATAEVPIRVNTPPKADPGPNLACCVGKEAQFNASASTDPDGDALTYVWDFGDGTKAYGAIVSHTFTKSGSYNVNVTVDDNSGSVCSKSSAGFVAEVNTQPIPVLNIR